MIINEIHNAEYLHVCISRMAIDVSLDIRNYNFLALRKQEIEHPGGKKLTNRNEKMCRIAHSSYSFVTGLGSR